MILKTLKLQNFRSYPKREFNFSERINLVTGPNTSGKTNLLESIYLLATGKSFRAEIEKEMIQYGNEIARIEGVVLDGRSDQKERLETTVTTGLVNGEKTHTKIFKVNGVPRRLMDFVGNLNCVLFRPEDLEIIIDSPSIRRNYLDSVLEPIDRDYRRASLSYKKGLRQRNRLLEQIREEGRPRSVLYFWDKLLVENGAIINQKRAEFIEFVNQQPDYFGNLVIEYDQSIISPQRLAKYADEEVAAGMTLVGPHRDNIKFKINNLKLKMEKDLSIYGSRGEQRTAIFSLKLAELAFVNQKTGQPPLLLLDDIFSELDHEHRKRLLEVIPHQQTIITTTDLHLIEPEQRKKMEVISLEI